MRNRSGSRALLTLAGVAALVFAVMAPAPAHAWWRGGVYVGVVPFPFFAPPVVVAPPVYYGPPPGYPPPPPPPGYAPGYSGADGPAYAQGGVPGQTCSAGPYVCPLDRPMSPGSTCYCPSNTGGRVYGNVR